MGFGVVTPLIHRSTPLVRSASDALLSAKHAQTLSPSAMEKVDMCVAMAQSKECQVESLEEQLNMTQTA